jgi:hypothetical protein
MRRVAAALLVLVTAAAPAAASGPRSLVFGDPAGDADFINDGGEHESGNLPTPTSEPSLDLRQVEVAPLTRAGSTVGFTVSITMEAALKERVQLSVGTRTANCPDIVLRYVHDEADPAAWLSSGCPSNWQPLQVEATPLEVRVERRKVTIVVPFTALPEKARQDKVLTRVNAASHVHVAQDPMTQRSLATNLVDTTLQNVAYRMR